MPLFREVASIVSGDSLESSASLVGWINNGGVSGSGGAGTFTDRPTITYASLTGGQFNRNFLTPVPPSSPMLLLQARWPADLVQPLTLESINGRRGPVGTGDHSGAGSEGCSRAIELIAMVQREGGASHSLRTG